MATLTEDDVAPVLATAQRYWTDAGIPTAWLADCRVAMGALPTGVAAETLGQRITLPADGAGWGWYADATPSLNEESGCDDADRRQRGAHALARDGRHAVC